MLAPLDHPAGKNELGSSSNYTITATMDRTTLSPLQDSSHQIDTSPSSSQPKISAQQQCPSSSSLTCTASQSPGIEYLILPVNNNPDEDSFSPRVMVVPSPTGSTSYALPSIAQPPSPSPSPTTIPPLQHYQQQQHQDAYAIPESMGHDSIGDFAYIGTFPDHDADTNVYNSSSSYEMNPRGYESFQQTYNVQHLNRSFNPESPESHASPRQQQQQQALYPQAPIVMHRAYSDPYVVPQQQQQQQVYPEPALVDTRENETNRSSERAIATRSRSQSSTSSSPPTLMKLSTHSSRRRKKIYWIGIMTVGTLLGAIIALVVVFKTNKHSDEESNTGAGNNDALPFPPKYTATPVSSIPVPIPTSGTDNNNGRVTAPPLPTPLPSGSQCPPYFCSDYYWNCRDKVCIMDDEYRKCRATCFGPAISCEVECSRASLCVRQCQVNVAICWERCPEPST